MVFQQWTKSCFRVNLESMKYLQRHDDILKEEIWHLCSVEDRLLYLMGIEAAV